MEMNPREKQFADLLEEKNIRYEFQPIRFEVGNTHYTPDFYIPIQDTYYEVIGSRQRYHQAKDKYELFKKEYPTIILKIVTPDGEPYNSRQATIEHFCKICKRPFFSIKTNPLRCTLCRRLFWNLDERPKRKNEKKLYQCLRCSHKWYGRERHKSKVCPKCQTKYWETGIFNGGYGRIITKLVIPRNKLLQIMLENKVFELFIKERKAKGKSSATLINEILKERYNIPYTDSYYKKYTNKTLLK